MLSFCKHYTLHYLYIYEVQSTSKMKLHLKFRCYSYFRFLFEVLSVSLTITIVSLIAISHPLFCQLHLCVWCDCDTLVSHRAHFTITPTFTLTTGSKEAYLSSLEIFRDFLFHWRTLFSLLHTVPDTRLDRTGSPVDFLWELEEQRKRVKEDKKCPFHLCHRVKGWYSAYVTVSILSGRPPAILILIWSSWGWEYETLNKTAAMDLLLSHTHACVHLPCSFHSMNILKPSPVAF